MVRQEAFSQLDKNICVDTLAACLLCKMTFDVLNKVAGKRWLSVSKVRFNRVHVM